MKKLLSMLLLLVFVMGGFTSCRDDDYDYEEVSVYTYKAIPSKKKGDSRYLYSEPSTDSRVVATIKGDGEIGLCYSTQTIGDRVWYELGERTLFTNDRPRKGWIPADQVERCGSDKIKVEVTSRAKMMSMADQPIAHFILNTKEQVREKYPLDDQSLYICTLYSLLIWGLFAVIRCTHSVRIWHIVVMFVVAMLQYSLLLTCDIFNLSGQFGEFIMDLVIGLLWITAPIAQIWVMQAVLTPILLGAESMGVDDQEDLFMIVKGHFTVTLLSIIVLLLCYYFNKDWVDWVIIFCGIVQLIVFIVMLFISEGKFLRVMLYMILFIILSLPTVYISLNSFVMALAIFATLALLFAPIGGGKVADAVGCKIIDVFGTEVDEVDGNGHSDKTGNNYDKNIDGTVSKR